MKDHSELKRFDDSQRSQNRVTIIAGFDEAGRGCLCGPVAAGGVVLPADFYDPSIDDSKKLTAAARRRAEAIIKEKALAWAVRFVGPEEIDRINILEASRLAMKLCLEDLCKSLKVEYIIADYMDWPTAIPLLKLKHGDALSESVAAASILAKTARDRYMAQVAEKYPQYRLEKHKGYGTKEHLNALAKYGVIKGLYRLSYAPVQDALAQKGYNDFVPTWEEA